MRETRAAIVAIRHLTPVQRLYSYLRVPQTLHSMNTFDKIFRFASGEVPGARVGSSSAGTGPIGNSNPTRAI